MEQQVNADFSNKIILSDKDHFYPDRLINGQNCRICGSENLRLLRNKCIHNSISV